MKENGRELIFYPDESVEINKEKEDENRNDL